MRTDRWLWLLFSVVAFVLLGFVHPMSEAVEYQVGSEQLLGKVVRSPRLAIVGSKAYRPFVHNALHDSGSGSWLGGPGNTGRDPIAIPSASENEWCYTTRRMKRTGLPRNRM